MKISEILNRELYLAIQRNVIEKLIKTTPTKTGDTAASWNLSFGDRLGEFIISNKRGKNVIFLEEGTRAHTILPVTKNMLKFRIKEAPQFRNAKDQNAFNVHNKIFFYSRTGMPILGYVKEGSLYYCFTKKVNHPGISARHFVRDILNDKAMWHSVFKEAKQKVKKTETVE